MFLLVQPFYCFVGFLPVFYLCYIVISECDYDFLNMKIADFSNQSNQPNYSSHICILAELITQFMFNGSMKVDGRTVDLYERSK